MCATGVARRLSPRARHFPHTAQDLSRRAALLFCEELLSMSWIHDLLAVARHVLAPGEAVRTAKSILPWSPPLWRRPSPPNDNNSAASCNLRGSTWALHASCTRGTGSSMFEYGDALEHAGARVEVVFCSFFPDPSYNSTVQRFQDRWPGRVVELGGGKTADSSFDFNAHLSSKVTHLYAQLHGGPHLHGVHATVGPLSPQLHGQSGQRDN